MVQSREPTKSNNLCLQLSNTIIRTKRSYKGGYSLPNIVSVDILTPLIVLEKIL